MARDTGFAWSARSRAVDVLFHLPSLIRDAYWGKEGSRIV